MGTLLTVLLALQATPTEALVQKGTQSLKSQVNNLRRDPEFSLWILLSADVPAASPVVKTLLDDSLMRLPETTRSAALQAMALQILDPAKYRIRIAHCAQFLIDVQCDDGRWDAGKPVEFPALPPEPKRQAVPRAFGAPAAPALPKTVLKRLAPGGKTGDSVNSRWAAWGLLACHQAGILFPAETVELAAKSWREGDHDPTEVVSALSICLFLKKQDFKKDPDVLKAVDRLAARDPRTDPASLFLLKWAMVQFGSDKLGGRDWRQDGIKALAASQDPDGSWGTVEDTCYATFFLHSPD